MNPRTSTRSRKASSPPRSPPAVRTRATRSQSVDVGAKPAGKAKSRQQASEDGVASANDNIFVSRDLPDVEEDEDDDDIQSVPLAASQSYGDDGGSSQEASPSQSTNQFVSPQSRQLDLESEDLRVNHPDVIQSFKNRQNMQSTPSASRPIANMAPQTQAGQSHVNNTAPVASVQEATDDWGNYSKLGNKENRNPAPSKRRYLDAHPDATKDSWDTQVLLDEDYADPGPSRKRGLPEQHDEPLDHVTEEEESQDEGFQQDARVVDSARRVRPVEGSNPNKRARREEVPSSGRYDEGISGTDRHADIMDNFSIEQIARTTARHNVQQATLSQRKVQRRVPWSPHDEALLVKYIGDYGAAWSVIAKFEDFERERGVNFQVDCKDKARNIKQSLLKNRMLELPLNFHAVRLGKKELAAVHKVFPEYDQDAELAEAQAVGLE